MMCLTMQAMGTCLREALNASFYIQHIAEAKIQTKGKHMSKWERAKISNFIEL